MLNNIVRNTRRRWMSLGDDPSQLLIRSNRLGDFLRSDFGLNCNKVENAFAGDLFFEEELTAMKAEWLRPNPSLADQVLVTMAVVDYLAYHQAANDASVVTESAEMSTALQKVVTITQKRLRESMKALELHKRSQRGGETQPTKFSFLEPLTTAA